MPFLTEYACRLKDPDLFKAESFRRVSRRHNDKEYFVIIGKLKSDDSLADQTMRYPTKDWTEKSAKAHCDEHGGMFETIKKEDEKKVSGNVKQLLLSHPLWSLKASVVPLLSQSLLACGEENRDISPELGFMLGNIYFLQINGVLTQDSLLLGWDCQSYKAIGNKLRELAVDPQVKQIVLDIDSAGGSVFGVAELAEQIYALRGQKPIIAYINNMACSAAYWLAAACDKVYCASETSLYGSIGCVAVHVDISQLEQAMGVKTTEVTAGKYKRAVSEYAALSDEGRRILQQQCDTVYGIFLTNVAKYRNLDVRKILEYAEGNEYLGLQASGVLTDGLMSLDNLIKGANMPDKEKKCVVAPPLQKNPSDTGETPNPANPESPESPEMTEEEKKKKQEEEQNQEQQQTTTTTTTTMTPAAIKKAVEAERARIMALDEIQDEFNRDIVLDAKRTGKTAEQIALQILKSGASKMKAMKADNVVVPYAGEYEKAGGEEVLAKKATEKINARRK